MESNGNNQHKYDDIINLPYIKSKTHEHMPQTNRAAQFAPFAALTGYDESVEEAARETSTRIVLSEDQKSIINMNLNIIKEIIIQKPRISVTYFIEDSKKAGGRYVTLADRIDKIDENKYEIILNGNTIIPINDILNIFIEERNLYL